MYAFDSWYGLLGFVSDDVIVSSYTPANSLSEMMDKVQLEKILNMVAWLALTLTRVAEGVLIIRENKTG